MIDISVIIVAYKKLDLIVDCIKSIIKFNDIGDRLEIIVVDNSPTDEIYDYINSNYPLISCYKNENKGFGQANNIGAKKSKGKYLIFLNPDTILVEPIFKFAIDKFNNDSNLGLFGLKLVDINMRSNFSFFYIDRNNLMYNTLIKIFNKYNVFIDGKMFISGANIFIRKEVFMKIGMFDENIFMYCEEKDLIRRMKPFGKKTAFFKQKKIIHLEGKTSNDTETALKRRLESTLYYCKKYNINFKTELHTEIRKNFLKSYIFKLIDKKRASLYKNNISIIKSYLQ